MSDRELLELAADEMRDVLLRNGFVECDIPACNCGSWHHRYGLPERMREIEEALSEADHEMSNENGHSILRALNALIARRDAAERENERLIADLKEAVGLRVKLYRHSDFDGDTDRLTDRQVAERDEFAMRWLATIDATRAAEQKEGKK